MVEMLLSIYNSLIQDARMPRAPREHPFRSTGRGYRQSSRAPRTPAKGVRPARAQNLAPNSSTGTFWYTRCHRQRNGTCWIHCTGCQFPFERFMLTTYLSSLARGQMRYKVSCMPSMTNDIVADSLLPSGESTAKRSSNVICRPLRYVRSTLAYRFREKVSVVCVSPSAWSFCGAK